MENSDTQKELKNFEMKKRENYHELDLQIDTFLVVVVFGNFQNMCKKLYRLDPGYFLQGQG